ncbi:MAG: MFS transporter [Proteobacteria bacterium]|nr:MFS transporter [Pseudomonadota bacterium]
MSEHSQFKLLSSRRFAPFFVTQSLGALNDNIFKNGLAALIVFRSAELAILNTDQLVNLSALLFILPFFLFSALFGQFADKFEKSRQIRLIKLFEIIIMLLATVGFYYDSLPLLLGVLFLLGFQSTTFGPIKYGILPQILRRDELIGGNALTEAGTFVAILAGTILGPQLAGIPAAWPVWVAAACLLVAMAGWLASRAIPLIPATAPELKINWNIFSESVCNLKYLKQHRVVLNSVLGISWFWFFGATFLVQIPSFTYNLLGGDKHLMSFLLGLFIVGISLGSLLCEKLSRHQIEIGLVPLGSLGLTVFGIDLYFASPESAQQVMNIAGFFNLPHSGRMVFDLIMIGVFGGFYTVPLYALIQQRTPPEHRSRVIAGNNIVNALLMVISAGMAMLLLGNIGLSIPELFLVTALLNVLVGVYIFTVVPEFFMRFVVWLMMKSIYRIKVVGLENIPVEGGVIVASNHVSFIDPLLLGGIVTRPLRYAMYYKIYKFPGLGWLFRAAKAFPIASRKEDPEILAAAYRRMHEILDEGDVLGIFPEGHVTRDGEIDVFQHGVEKLVGENPVPVVPVAIRNLWGSVFSRKANGFKRRPRKFWQKIEVIIGEPIPADELTSERLEAEVRKLRGDVR